MTIRRRTRKTKLDILIDGLCAVIFGVLAASLFLTATTTFTTVSACAVAAAALVSVIRTVADVRRQEWAEETTPAP